VFDFVPYSGAPAGDIDLYLKQSVFLTSFANGVPRRTAMTLYASQRPATLSSGNQPSGVPAWKTIPSWYLLGTEDLVIPAAQQRFMAQRAGARITEVNAGHLSMIIRPDATTDVILKAARRTA
jgi:pimeloyl-ACP methyl ester carboxylesterase